MSTATATMTGTVVTPAELGGKHIRWGLGMFIFGLIIGFIPLLHYMRGSKELVGQEFLQRVTLWWGCAFAVAASVVQIGGLSMIAIGLCYVVLNRSGAITSLSSAERLAPALCMVGLIADVVAAIPGYYAVASVWPNFFYAPVDQGKWTWLGMQIVCIAIYTAGVICACGGISKATKQLA
jgi:hypothetical protein